MVLTLKLSLAQTPDQPRADFNDTVTDEIIWSITREKSGQAAELARLAARYIDAYNDFSYNIDRNGERRLLSSLAPIAFNIIFDVGANVGRWSLTAGECFKSANIHAFELSSETHRLLAENLIGDRFIKNNLGLADRDGILPCKVYENGSTMTTLLTEATYWDRQLSYKLVDSIVITGDEYCISNDIESIDFLKIDVEGAEHLVLVGFERMLSDQRIRCIQFEYGYTHGDARFLMKDFYNLLTEKGYVIGRIRSDGVEFEDFRYDLNDFKSGPNYFACRKSDEEVMSRVGR